MKKFKFLSILTVFGLGLLVLIACGDDNEPTADDEQPPIVNDNGNDT